MKRFFRERSQGSYQSSIRRRVQSLHPLHCYAIIHRSPSMSLRSHSWDTSRSGHDAQKPCGRPGYTSTLVPRPASSSSCPNSSASSRRGSRPQTAKYALSAMLACESKSSGERRLSSGGAPYLAVRVLSVG